jgi:hypothetical protein
VVGGGLHVAVARRHRRPDPGRRHEQTPASQSASSSTTLVNWTGAELAECRNGRVLEEQVGHLVGDRVRLTSGWMSLADDDQGLAVADDGGGGERPRILVMESAQMLRRHTRQCA